MVFVNYFDNWRIGKGRLYDLTSLTYTYENRRWVRNTETGNTYAYNIDKTAISGNSSMGDKNKIGTDDQSMRIARINLLQNFTYKINEGNRIELNNFLLNDGRNTVDIAIKHRNESPDLWQNFDNYAETRQNTFTFQQRFLYNGNLGGYHRLDRKQAQELHWNLGYSYSMQDIPDQRISSFRRSIDTKLDGLQASAFDAEQKGLRWVADFDSPESIFFGLLSRLFVRNRENVYNASADYSFLVKPSFQLKAGTYQLFRTRAVNRRFFKVLPGGLNGTEQDLSNSPNSVRDNNGQISPNLIYFREQDLATIWNAANFFDNGSGLKVFDVSAPTDRYVASEQNNSGYVQGEWRGWKERLIVNAGLRYEHNAQRVSASGGGYGYVFYPVPVNLYMDNWLPSVNLNFRPDSLWVIRASYGRTVNRPEFREITSFTDYDFLNGENVHGNPRLKSSVIDNFDLRLELYPHSGENISIGAFYKYIDKPIERTRFDMAGDVTGPDLANINFFNPDKARVYGLELDLRKNLDFIPGKLFRNLSVVANGAWMKSKASRVYKPDPNSNGTGPGERIGSFSGRPLQGQAPYIINGSLFYDNPGWGTKLGVTYNVSGVSIYAIGDGNAAEMRALQQRTDWTQAQFVKLNTRPGLLELPRNQLDLSFTQRLYKSLQMRINIQNLLDVPYRLVEDHNWDNKYQPEQRRPAAVPFYKNRGDYYYEGDNDFLHYKPGRYFTTTFTYVF